MDNWMMPMVMLLAAGNKGKVQSTDVIESVMVNEMPKGPRSVLSMTQAIDRANQQTQNQQAATKRETDLASLIDQGKVAVTADLSSDPRMVFMLQKIADPSLKNRVTQKLKGTGLNPSTG